jgi:hypothetical protein
MNRIIFSTVCLLWTLLLSGCFQTSVDESVATHEHRHTYTIIIPGTTNKWTNVYDWETDGYGNEVEFTDTNGKRIKANSFLMIEE